MRDGAAWDGTCPTCGQFVINTLVPVAPKVYQPTWNCPACDDWWDYYTGRPVYFTPSVKADS